MTLDRPHARQAFAEYTSHYNAADPKVKLKIDHTYRVAALCERIANSLSLSPQDVDLAWLCGLLHDVGRFEQLRRYGTFIDAKSIDHALMSVTVLFEEGRLRDYIADTDEDTLLRTAIRLHNAYRLPEELDDRGYVEPETEVYRRFAELAEQTAAGLQVYGILDPADRENLTRLASLARSLETISRKELQNERLSDEEYDLIREYGGTLEHFWIEAVKDRTDAEYLDAREIPASLVTDIATDPNGTVLQAANGRPAQIYVIVPVDGTLRIASGVVYNFYQFCQPLSARLTDSEWRQMIGEWMSPDGRFHQDETPEKPWWTQSYWVQG